MKTKNNERIPGELTKMKDNKRSPENRRNEQQVALSLKSDGKHPGNCEQK